MKKLISVIAIVAFTAAIALVSCNKEEESAVLQGISITPDSAVVKVGTPLTLTVVYSPENAADKPSVVWSSSDTNVAVVVNGKVTTMKAGAATITATAGGFSAKCNLTVENDVPIEGTSNVSLIGTFLGTNWDRDLKLAEVETGIYVIKHVTLVDTDKFKIRYDNSWDVNRGGTFVELGKGFAVVEHGDDVIPGLNGTYDIWYNKDKEQMAVVVKDGTPVWE